MLALAVRGQVVEWKILNHGVFADQGGKAMIVYEPYEVGSTERYLYLYCTVELL